MKKQQIILIILLLVCVSGVYSQNSNKFSTDAFGIYPELSDCKVKQISGKLHYNPLINPGVHIFYKYSFYPNKKYFLAGTVSSGINFLKETITVPASDYNLKFDYWDGRNIYIPNLSVSLSYSHLFLTNNNNLYFASFGAGLVSAIGYNQQMTYDMAEVDSLILVNEVYNYKPTPIFILEFGKKTELKNGNFLNLSVFSQLSFSEKYIISHEFFVNEPKYTSSAQIITKLMFVGVKFSYEIKQKK